MKMSNFSEEKNENTSKVVYDRNDMLCVLKELDFILCSLHDIASYYLQSSTEQYKIETTNFIDNSLVCSRLANIREKLSESFDLVENVDGLDIIEQYCQNTPYWESPGDCCTTFWLNTD